MLGLLVLVPTLGSSPLSAQSARADGWTMSVWMERNAASLTWNVGPAADSKVSELRFEDMLAYQPHLEVRYGVSVGEGTLEAFAGGGAGRTRSGRMSDSDFTSGGAVEAFRVEADVTGIEARFGEVGVAWRWRPGGQHPLEELALSGGFEWAGESIRMQHGRHTIGVGVSLLGLDSRYRARWAGTWFELRPALRIGSGTLSAHLRATVPGWYRSEGTWNLRRDLAQPRSFTQRGDGWGHAVGLEYVRPMSRHLAITMGVRRSRRVVRNGEDHAYRSDGHVASLMLRRMEWEETALRLGVRATF